MEQEELFDNLPDTYNLVGLKEACFDFIKHKYPNPDECEDMEDYIQFIHDEAMLEFASRMRLMADQIEKGIYEPQSKMIKALYKDLR